MNDKISRRTFLKSGAIGLAGLPVLSQSAYIKVYHIPLHDAGIRADLLRDPAGTLLALAGAGFKELEYSGETNHTYYGLKPTEFKKILDDSTISMPIGQAVFKKSYWLENKNEVSDEWKNILENALTIGQEYLISPLFDWDVKNTEELKKGVEAYNRCGELCDQAGIRLGFHPSVRELETKHQGQPVYGYMLQHWDPRSLCQQLDLIKAAKTNDDPLYWMRLYPHHFESLHVQDQPRAEQAGNPLGQGTLDLDGILAFARKNTPIKYWVIKADPATADAPWQALGKDLTRFKLYGFV